MSHYKCNLYTNKQFHTEIMKSIPQTSSPSNRSLLMLHLCKVSLQSNITVQFSSLASSLGSRVDVNRIESNFIQNIFIVRILDSVTDCHYRHIFLEK